MDSGAIQIDNHIPQGLLHFKEDPKGRMTLTEASIQRSLARVAHNRTVVVVAHRLSTIRHADHIHVVSAGSIVESGTHDDLVDHPGIYRSLWAVQTGVAVGD
jgi:ABC-type transport system involved in Fe-S cluster assembly fused permease/ATPase subunit